MMLPSIPNLYGDYDGRERPHELFGRLKAEKVGSLPPIFVVSIPLLFGFRFAYRIIFQQSAGP
jgi:hypothetical protein